MGPKDQKTDRLGFSRGGRRLIYSMRRDKRRPGSSSKFGEASLPDGSEPSAALDLGSLVCPVCPCPCRKEEGVERGEGGGRKVKAAV